MHQGLGSLSARIVDLRGKAHKAAEWQVLPFHECSSSLQEALEAALDLSVLVQGIEAASMEQRLLSCRQLTGDLSVIYRRAQHGFQVLFRGRGVHGGHEASVASLLHQRFVTRPQAYIFGRCEVLAIPTETHLVALFHESESDA